MKNSIRKVTDWHERKRALIDNGARYAIGLGGVSIIFAVVLIFFYLLWVVLPIFKPVEVQQQTQFELPTGESVNRYLALEDSGVLAVRIISTGEIQFINLHSGQLVHQETVDLPEYGSVLDVIKLDREGHQLALMLDNTRVLFIEINYRVNFVEGKREIIATVAYPYGEEAHELKGVDHVVRLAAQRSNDNLILAALDSDGELMLQRYDLEDDPELSEPKAETLVTTNGKIDYILFGANANWMYLADRSGAVQMYKLNDLDDIELISTLRLLPPERQLMHLQMLLGEVSMLAADDQGKITQWSLQRDAKNQYGLQDVRSFKSDYPLVALVPEHRRKGLVAINSHGELDIYYTTSERNLFSGKLINGEVVRALKLPDVRERMGFETIQPVGSTSAELADFLKREIVKWGAIIKESGAKVD